MKSILNTKTMNVFCSTMTTGPPHVVNRYGMANSQNVACAKYTSQDFSTIFVWICRATEPLSQIFIESKAAVVEIAPVRSGKNSTIISSSTI